MPIKFVCPKCNKAFTVKEEHAGAKGKCPCGEVFSVPLQTVTPIQKPALRSTKISRKSFLILIIGLGAITWCISFAFGAIFFKPKPVSEKIDMVKVKQIECQISDIKKEIATLEKDIAGYKQFLLKLDEVTKPK